MTKDRKLLFLVLFLSLLTIFSIIVHYEGRETPLLEENRIVIQTDIPKVVFTANEIRAMIKMLPNYQGDSLYIDADGKLQSKDALIQSVIDQMYLVPANYESIKREAQSKSLPEPFCVYQQAIHYYVIQYGSKSKKDTVISNTK